MFYQTQHRNQAPEITPGMDWMVFSIAAAAAPCLQRAYTNTIRMLSRVSAALSAFFVPGDLDLWPWHSNSSKQETKHVLSVNLAQMCSAVPEIFDAQTKWKKMKKSQTLLKIEPYLRVVMSNH